MVGVSELAQNMHIRVSTRDTGLCHCDHRLFTWSQRVKTPPDPDPDQRLRFLLGLIRIS